MYYLLKRRYLKNFIPHSIFTSYLGTNIEILQTLIKNKHMKNFNITNFASKLNAIQILDNKAIQNIKGGAQSDPPPFGADNVAQSDPPPFGVGNA